MKKTFLERMAEPEILLADGALGSVLMKMDLTQRVCPESVNLQNPSVLESIARAYLGAGSELIQTNTFGASALKLAKFGLADRTEEINRIAVEAVRNAVADQAYIVGSCGPSGQLLLPYGNTQREDMLQSFQRQLSALVQAGVDLICLETMTDVQEILVAIEALRNVSATMPLWVSLTFDKTPRGYFSVMGVDVPTAVAQLASATVDVLGSNCGNGIDNMLEIAGLFKDSSALPIAIQPNAGMPELVDNRLVYAETPEFMAGYIDKLVDLDVAIIGGCCGTTPEHIRLFRRVLSG